MKKILSILSAAAVLFGAASCAKDNLGQIKEVNTANNPLNTILVKVASDTKLAVDSDNLTPAFEEGDEIFGWDKDGNTYAYKCKDVAEDVATFERTSEGAPSDVEGTLINLVYAPGYGIKDIKDNTLDVNLAVQGEVLPVVMHAMGEVDAQGLCEVVFYNDVAIVDIKDAVLPGAAENDEYTIAFHGKYTSLKFALSEWGFINYEAAVEGPISSSVKAKVSADSKISKKFAVPASLEATDVIITATAADGSSYSFSAGSKEIKAGNYITVSGKEFAPQYVAQIGEDQYTSLAKAVAAANASEEDVTVKMLEDAESSSALNINNANSKKVTLDLNGCTLSSQIIVTTDFEVADATGRGVVEAAASTIKMGADGEFGVNATFTLNGGTVMALTGNYAVSADGIKDGPQPVVLIKKGDIVATGNAVRIKYAKATFGDETEGDINLISAGANGIWTSTESEVTINKGTYDYTGTGKLYYFGAGSCVVAFNGGTFNSNAALFGYYSTSNNPSITIKDGKFTWDGSKDFVQAKNTKVSVSGGYFSNPVPPSCVEEGYICAESSEIPGYSYKVIVNADNSVMMVGTEKFENLADAIAKANQATEATTIKVLKNLEITSAIEFTTAAPLTLDLNGYSIVASNLETATPAIQMDNEGVNLTIVDNSASGAGYINQTFAGEGFAIYVNTGTLNIESGSVRNTSSKGYGRIAIKVAGIENKAAAEVNIKGGHILGGRAMSIGSGNTVVPVINITGGLIEATYNTDNDKTYQYGTLAFTAEGYKCTITGGILLSDYGPCFYTNRSAENSTLVFGDPEDSSKIPYLYTVHGDWCFRTGSKNASSRLFVYNAYCNNPTDKNEVFRGTGAIAHELDPKVKDEDDREYTHWVYVEKVPADN